MRLLVIADSQPNEFTIIHYIVVGQTGPFWISGCTGSELNVDRVIHLDFLFNFRQVLTIFFYTCMSHIIKINSSSIKIIQRKKNDITFKVQQI